MVRKQEVLAAVLEKRGRINPRTFPYPESIPDDAAVVKMKMCGICGTDHHLKRFWPAIPTPVILGHECLGEIYEIGDKASKNLEARGETLAEGDRVTWYAGILCGKCWYCKNLPSNHMGSLCMNVKGYGQNISCKDPPHLFGGYSEYVYILPKTWVYKVPENLTDEVAVLTDTFAVATGVRKAMMPFPALKEGFGPSDTVVIQGSGPIGLAAGITAKLCGAYKVILVGGEEQRIKMAEKLGIFDLIVDINETTSVERIKMVKDATPGKVGPDLVVEAAGVPETIPEGLEMARRGGTYLEMGNFIETGKVEISPFQHLCFKDIILIGQFAIPPQTFDVAFKFLEMALDRGIPVDKMVTTKYKINNAAEAFEKENKYKGVKSIVVP